MKKIVLFIIGLVFFTSVKSQTENPARILAYKTKESLDRYMHRYKWHYVKDHQHDAVDGVFHLYRKKTIGHGYMYMAVHLKKYMHYQVFFDDKTDYSLVLNYDDFLLVPTGKSRFNESIENDVYAIKSVTFEDPKDIRNKNVFFGIIEEHHHPDAELEKGDMNLHEHAKTENPHEMEVTDEHEEDLEKQHQKLHEEGVEHDH